jgi:hypothetical protein
MGILDKDWNITERTLYFFWKKPSGPSLSAPLLTEVTIDLLRHSEELKIFLLGILAARKKELDLSRAQSSSLSC